MSAPTRAGSECLRFLQGNGSVAGQVIPEWGVPLNPPAALPPELSQLLGVTNDADVERAWARFIDQHNRLLLHTCRSVERDHDAAMDGYTHILGALREDGFRRLRAYAPRANTQFTTWLVVVARRLLLDFHRHRYGRPRAESGASLTTRETRRRLEDLVATELDPEQLAAPTANAPDQTIRRRELTSAVQRAMSELDPADRLLLALRFEDDRPVREIAETMRFPTVFHVYRRVDAALDRLKRALAARGVLEPEP